LFVLFLKLKANLLACANSKLLSLATIAAIALRINPLL
jgi:hypothetical protein